VPLEETLEAFDVLKQAGKIRYWGVSNFDTDDMEELTALTQNDGRLVASNQVLYNPVRRGIEHSLLPWCRARAIPIMAYSPLEQGTLMTHKALKTIGHRLNATPAQVVLAWVLRGEGVLAIPKAGRVEHVRENRGALDIQLSPDDLQALDKAFPPPAKQTPLEML
jgi:diketogulonate reductase-like aldo/keto reductase